MHCNFLKQHDPTIYSNLQCHHRPLVEREVEEEEECSKMGGSLYLAPGRMKREEHDDALVRDLQNKTSSKNKHNMTVN